MPPTWPAVTDDAGDFITGTVWTKAIHDAIKTYYDYYVFSTTYPGVYPSALIDEVVIARGSKLTLDARLDVSINDDGTLKAIAGQASEAELVSFAAGNWIYDEDFLIWHAGDAAAPAGWTLDGAGASVARCGTGLGDTNTKVGPYCAKVTRAAADTTLSQYLLNTTSFGVSGACLKTRTFAFGAWVKTSVANQARVRIGDGVGGGTASSYHTGSGNWEFLSATHTVSGSATYLRLFLEVLNSSGDAYFSGPSAMPGQVALSDWVPCPKVYGTVVFKKGGTLVAAAGTNLDRFLPSRPLLIKDVQLSVLTAPTDASIIIDVSVWDGAAWQSMFVTLPTIVATATEGAAQPDGTYRYRCVTGGYGTTITNALLGWDIHQVGATIAGADLLVMVRALQYTRPQENLLDEADY